MSVVEVVVFTSTCVSVIVIFDVNVDNSYDNVHVDAKKMWASPIQVLHYFHYLNLRQ